MLHWKTLFVIGFYTSSLVLIQIVGIIVKGKWIPFTFSCQFHIIYSYFSWCCVRIQTVESVNNIYQAPTSVTKSISNATDWCQDADDWDDKSNANINEENGNLINIGEKVSDEDDESCSFEESVCISLGTLSVDDKNANMGGSPEAQGEIYNLLYYIKINI